MNAMENLDRAANDTYRPILRVSETRRPDFEQSECCCPELCQVDHDN